MALFRQLNREQGITIVIVTHDPEIGKQMDRVIGLRDGRIAENILQEYYHVALPAEELELPVLEKEPVTVPVVRKEQE